MPTFELTIEEQENISVQELAADLLEILQLNFTAEGYKPSRITYEPGQLSAILVNEFVTSTKVTQGFKKKFYEAADMLIADQMIELDRSQPAGSDFVVLSAKGRASAKPSVTVRSTHNLLAAAAGVQTRNTTPAVGLGKSTTHVAHPDATHNRTTSVPVHTDASFFSRNKTWLLSGIVPALIVGVPTIYIGYIQYHKGESASATTAAGSPGKSNPLDSAVSLFAFLNNIAPAQRSNFADSLRNSKVNWRLPFFDAVGADYPRKWRVNCEVRDMNRSGTIIEVTFEVSKDSHPELRTLNTGKMIQVAATIDSVSTDNIALKDVLIRVE